MSTVAHHQTTQQMIAEIEKKDRRFRIALSVFIALIMATLVGVIAIQIQILNGVQDQLDAQDRTVQELRETTEAANDRQIQHLQCIAKFFAQTEDERSISRIESVDQCVLENTDTGEQS